MFLQRGLAARGILFLLSWFTVSTVLLGEANSQPAITSASGALVHKGVLTIGGSSFGSKTPAAPLIWDDAEGKTVESPDAVTAQGGWTEGVPKASSVKPWWRMQYRRSGWQGIQDYGRGEQYLVGGHWNNYSEQASNVGLTKAAASPPNQWYASWYVRIKFPPIDSTFLGYGNYKEYTFNSGTNIYTGSFAYLATSGEYSEVVSGGSYGPSHQAGFCSIGDKPQAMNKKRSEQSGWKHMEMVMQQRPGLLQYRLRDGQAVQTVFDYRCADGSNLLGFAPGSFSAGGFHKRSDTIGGQPAVRVLSDPLWYEWVPSAVSSNHYYLLLRNVPFDRNPDVDVKPPQLWIDGTARTEGNAALAQGLAEGQWDYGDFDGLGFNSVYVRLAGNADPDSFNSIPGFIQIRIYSGSTQRQEPNAWRYFDDLYMDTTLSRVVLANHQDYSRATIVEPQIPTTWSNNSITVTINLGSLSSGGYLFVFDALNNHNAVGFPVGAVDAPPGAPFLRAPR